MALSENQPGEVPDDERLRLYIKVPEGRDEDEVKQHFKGESFFYFCPMRHDSSSSPILGFRVCVPFIPLISSFVNTLINCISF